MMRRVYHKIKNALPGFARLSSIPAGMIDKAYLEDNSSFLSRAWRFSKIRAIYLGLFLPSVGIDLLTSAAIASRYVIGSFLTTDEVQDRRLAQQKKYTTLFSKNLLALVFAPVGLYSPKIVELTFISDKSKEGVVSGGGYYVAPNAQYQFPKDEDELIQILQDAAQYKRKVMPVGAGRSQGKQFLPEGEKSTGEIVIDLREFNSIAINSEDKTAIVGAGVRWSDLQLQADKNKLALKVMQASNIFSVGGSIGTNIHGWDHQTGFLSNAILEMTIITPQGEKKKLTPNDALFHHITSGFGLFGIVTSVKLQLTDNELLKEKSVKLPIKDYVNYFYEKVQTNDNIRMHLCRLSLDTNNLLGYGLAVDYFKEGNHKPVVTRGLNKEGEHGTRFNRLMVNFARHFDWVRNKYWRDEESRLLANGSRPTTTNAIMQPPINAMFTQSVSEAEWLQEYFLPGENLDEFIKQLSRLLTENHVPLLNASIRFVKQDNRPILSPAHGGDRFAVVLCFNQSLQPKEVIKAQKWLRATQELTVNMGGSYYLPYQHVSSPEYFHKAYPRAKEMVDLKKQYDPENILSSGLYTKYIVPAPNKENYFKTIMHTAESRKQFAGFLQNVLQRVEADQIYALLEDILKYCDTHAEIYEELCQRLPEVMPAKVGSLKRILNSLSTIKEDLGQQAKVLLPGVKEIKGLVEIGYPGRFIEGFKKQFKVSGPIVAAYENPSITDYIQTGFPRPYHKFAKLDYANPSLSVLPDESADVITCYVGLHHFPTDKLEAFLADIRRVLRKGGHFLLIDHDVVNHHSLTMAQGAHMFFNAVNGVSLQDEMNEMRNFHSIAYWSELLAKYDLGYTVSGPDVKMIREGDPSCNRMVSFVKKVPKNELKQAINEREIDESSENKRKPQLEWKKTPQEGKMALPGASTLFIVKPKDAIPEVRGKAANRLVG